MRRLVHHGRQTEPPERQRNPDQYIEQGKNHKGRSPIPGIHTPTEQPRHQGSRDSGAREADRQRQTPVAVEPQIEQLRPGHCQRPHANDRQHEECEVERPDGPSNQGRRQVAQRHRQQRKHGDPLHAETHVEPAHQLQTDDSTAKEEGDGGLKTAALPAERLLKWNH
ncbi:hypothetical protein SDC9_209490 [bioreactor metagenome]|uniref:Uncharacterized protein n=1 Tax=bioreactor metagenome TaxID=1076179 RepID=A0A645JDG4_9ZZZZ